MRRSWWTLLVVVGAVLPIGCRREEPAPEVPSSDSVAAPVDGDVPFSPPEIRRARPDSLDSLPAAPPADSAPARVASAPPPVVEAKPAPVAAVPEAAKPAPAAPATAAPGTVQPGESGEWVLQVDIQKSEAEAKKAIQKLAGKGIPAYVVPAATESGLAGSYWRVRVGRFGTRADAQTYGETVLKRAGLKYWIDRKSNETKGDPG